MVRILIATCMCLATLAPGGTSYAHSWFSDYMTGRSEFEECCGYEDCHTAASLGSPEIRKRKDGGYRVRLGKHWVNYDFPAVHTSEDSHTWICYLGSAADDPDPLCLFLPAGMM